MPKVAQEGKYTIRVHVRDEHPPPHVHVYYDDKMIRVSLYDLRIMDPVRAHEEKDLVAVVEKHQMKALEVWEKMNEGK